MTPEEIRNFYPKFIAEKMIELKESPETNDKPNMKVTDFLRIYVEISRISNKEYQERFWVRQKLGDNFMETTMAFNQNVKTVLKAKDTGRVKMTKRQYEMLQKLYNMINDFEANPDTPLDPGYGENDEEIVANPCWDKIRNYAKDVYAELIKEA